ncbi:MAG: glycogen synthase GlgA [Desulfuromonadales bacterium]|nr:glycogen synthase GlgA [Desulfuromonadales bacterium]MBN2793498.1 glycogen synthase GlgA [Desulfuromonadales bacterium]
MMNSDFSQTYYPLGFQCGRNAWETTRLTPQFAANNHPQSSYFRHLLADHLRISRGSSLTAAEMELWAVMNQTLRLIADDFLSRRDFHERGGVFQLSGQPVEFAEKSQLFNHFLAYFPSPPIELGTTTGNRLVELLEEQNQSKELLLELILLYVQSLNPALRDGRELFAAEEQQLQDHCAYRRQLELFDSSLPFSEDIHSSRPQALLSRLLEPIRKGKTLREQLDFLLEAWGGMLPDDLRERIATAYVQLEREGFGAGPPGEAELSVLDPATHSDEEYADFSVDLDWMPRTVLLAKSTYVWLQQLSARYQYPIRTLDRIPDSELDNLARCGFTSLWMIGIWQRSKASLKVKNLSGQVQVAASAYAIDDYRIADDLGGEQALENLRRRCRERNIDLACDVVTNHTGIESALMREHPDWFIQLAYPPYPGYRFSGPDLSDDPEYSIQIEDGYFDHSEAAVVCRYQHRHSGEVRYIYHGNDGTHLPWNDTAQLNYLLPQVREAMIQLIIRVAQRFRIIRFDAAMTLAKRHFQRLWYPLPGGGAGVPSREDHALSREEFERHFPQEFWRELVDRVRVEAPETLLVAEAFWLMEGYFVRTLGMHRVYNSAFMNMLKREENAKYRQTIKNILAFDPAILQRFVNFMSNPDEKPAVEQFGDGDKYFCVATMLATMPGLPMFGHGQVEGLHEKYGMEYLAPRWDEQPNRELIARHERQLFPLLRRRALFSGAERFQLYDFESVYGSEEDVFVYSNGLGERTTLVICNNSSKSISGRIGAPAKMADKEGISVIAACGIDVSQAFVLLVDQGSGQQSLQPAGALASGGEFYLDAYAHHAFGEFHPLSDPDGRWLTLWQRHGGRARKNLYLDHAAMLFEQTWEPAQALLAVSRPERAKRRVEELLAQHLAAYAGDHFARIPVDDLLEVLTHVIYPDISLEKRHLTELAERLAACDPADPESLFRLLERLCNDQDFRGLLGCHYFDHVDWLNREKLSGFCLLILQLELLTCQRDPEKVPVQMRDRIIVWLRRLQKILRLAEKLGFRADELLETLDPTAISGRAITVNKRTAKKILFVASEATPFAKTGGLADVVGSLPRALRQLGHDVQVVVPCYRSAQKAPVAPVKSGYSVEIVMQDRTCRGSLKRAVYDGVPYWLVDTPEFFDREELYGTEAGDYPDNALRFGFFSRAVLEMAKVINFRPEVIHVHDWQVGLIPALLKTRYASQEFYSATRTVLTIHNLGYQGMFPLSILSDLDLPGEFGSPEALEYYGRVSFLKGGINFADLVTTVSQRYCLEIQEPEQGLGFDGLLRARRDHLCGIINGLDQRIWNPQADQQIAAGFSAANLRGKSVCKKQLQRELGLEQNPTKPLIAVISRLDQQKGIDLIRDIWSQLLERNIQFVLLGSGNREQMAFWQAQQEKNAGQVSINLLFNEGLSHRLYAAADLLLVPSRYEPCGLTQMIALQYGALPLVRRTGGLADSVVDIDEFPHTGYGFVFDHAEPRELLAALDRALALYAQRRRWKTVVKRGMTRDFSWSQSAEKYLQLYRQLDVSPPVS